MIAHTFALVAMLGTTPVHTPTLTTAHSLEACETARAETLNGLRGVTLTPGLTVYVSECVPEPTEPEPPEKTRL